MQVWAAIIGLSVLALLGGAVADESDMNVLQTRLVRFYTLHSAQKVVLVDLFSLLAGLMSFR